MSENGNENGAETATGTATGAAMGAGAGAESTRRYRANQVVLVECEHVREMKGETAECLRRTRSVAAENAVLNAVRAGGVEPDWFCEWWVEAEGKLVACAVFEDAAKVGGFRKELQEYAEKMRARGEACPARIRADEKLAESVAAHFSAEWERRRTEQMGKYGEVLRDAVKDERYESRMVYGEYGARDDNAKSAFGKIAEEMNALFPHDEYGEGGIAYSGFWDKGNVARFCFGFPKGVDINAVARRFVEALGVDVYDPISAFKDGELRGVELEMAALVIAKMQGEERAKEERDKLAEELGKKMAEAVEEGFARSGKRRDAAELID